MIYIDASRYSNTPERTGVENYSYFLINQLIEQHSDQITLISPKKLPIKGVKQRIIWFPRLWTQIRLSIEVFWNKSIQTLFIPSHLMPIIHVKKTIITIHDVAFRRYPESYGKLSRWYLNWGAKFAVKKAYKIIVPSQITKDDLIKFYKADKNKIKVIPLGFKPPKSFGGRDAINRVPMVLNKYRLKPKKYFLFVGRIETKKNIKTLVSAFEKVSKNYPEYKLVLSGKEGLGAEVIKKMITNQGSVISNSKIVMTGYVNEDEKWALMKKARCFVFPSFFEGFGLPLLEAMSVNLPVIASNIPSSHEVMGDLILCFDATNMDELAHRMVEVIKGTEIMRRLVKNYPQRLAKFTWEKCAEATWQVLVSEKS